MLVYSLYALALAAIVIACISVVPGLSRRLRRWLSIAVAVLVILPAAIAILVSLFGR